MMKTLPHLLLLAALLSASAACGTKDVTPTDSIPDSRGAYKHVVIIGVDGGGAFFKDTDTPNCDEIFKDGAVTYRCKTSYPTISAQCWGSMLHSVLPEFHRLTNSIVSSRPYPVDSPYPSIFRVVREARPQAALASFCNWDPINAGIIENNLNIVEGTGNDAEVTRQIVSYLSGNTPTLLFVQFDSVDGAGHGSGYGSETHLTTLSVVDAFIGRIYDSLKKRNLLDDTLFIVSADHGGTPGGSHGGDTDEERYVFLGVAGKTVDKDTPIVDAEVRDIAAIAAYALGLDFPETWTGHVPTGIFKGLQAAERKVLELPISENRKHETVDTPELTKMQALLKGHPLIAYLPFDGDVTDAFKKVETIQNGKLYFHDAYFGQGAAFDDGAVTLKGVTVGKNSFSAAFWMKTNGTTSDPSLISNKDWNAGLNDGFVLSLREEDIKFNAGCKVKNERMDLTVPLPHDYKEGWMHVMLVVDRSSNKVRLYIDFTQEGECDIPAPLQDVSFDSLPFTIGQDGTGTYNAKLPAQVDELILTADALTADDVAALKAYYK